MIGIIPIFHNNKKKKKKEKKIYIPTSITIQLNLTVKGAVEFQRSVAAVSCYLSHKPPPLHLI